MPLPASVLIASPRRLLAAILLFVALDMTVLITNLRIADQVAEDAVAINLSGRQRMLSQRMTKALLLTVGATDAALAARSRSEFFDAYDLFEQTLGAFAKGGQTRGSDGRVVHLEAVNDAGAAPVARTRALLEPLSAVTERPRDVPGAPFDEAAAYMVSANDAILDAMNALTTALEHSSVQRTRTLQIIQAVAFVLALINFLAIVLGLLRRFREAEQEKAHWREMARHDALTGLLNRKGFFEAADRVLSRAAHDSGYGALILLDLDKFKPLNDDFGHPTGDVVLREFADRTRMIARQSDVLARIGGDEFVLLCPGLLSSTDIAHLCQRIVEAMEAIQPAGGATVHLGVSVGVATFPNDGYEIDRLIASADRAMYSAKRKGGNRWAHA